MELFNHILNGLSNPDWWSVIATFATAGAASWLTYSFGRRQEELTKRQEELQRQQVALAEYEINKQLYSVVKDIDELSTTLIIRIYNHFFGTAFVTFKRDILSETQDEILKAKDRFNDCMLDLEFRLWGKWESAELYRILLNEMAKVVSCMQEMEKKKIFERHVRSLGSNDEDDIINAIIDAVADDYQKVAEDLFYNFTRTRKQVSEINALKMIRERIKPLVQNERNLEYKGAWRRLWHRLWPRL